MPPLRTPSAWALAQREFHVAYLADPTAFARREVVLAWADVPGADEDRAPTGLPFRQLATGAVAFIQMLSNVIGGRFEGPEVTVLTTEGTTRAMRFPVGLERPPGPEVTDIATLVGEIGTNAVCCLELAGSVIWPTYNPTELSHPT